MKLVRILDNLFEDLNQKEKDVIFRRYGFYGEEETLEEIAEDYNLTRERIRQIQNVALKKIISLIKSHTEIKELIKESRKFLKPIGVRHEESFLNLVQDSFNFSLQEIKIFKFLTIYSSQIVFYPSDECLHNIYALEEKILRICRYILKKIYFNFLETKNLYHENELLNLIFKEIKRHLRVKTNYNELLDFLKILKNVNKNPFHFWGLKNNNFIVPKCLKDKIILIFKIEKRPLHFREIYQKLDSMAKIEDPMVHYIWRKSYNINSIKNELIRHPEFTFIKRGVYSLRENL